MTARTLPLLRGAFGSRFVREPIIIILAYIPYYLARHVAENAEVAFSNARELIRLESSIGIFKEVSVQSATISYEALIHLFNIIYFYGHWPVIIIGGAYLLIKHPNIYSITRNAFLISGVVALIFFALFPVAPPRLSADGIVDTMTLTVPVSYDNSPLVNPYAALPSMHVGWDLLIALGLFLGSRRRVVRLIAVLLPPSMWFATVVTGNHFFIDGALGSLLAVSAFLLALWLQPRWPTVLTALGRRLGLAEPAPVRQPSGRL